MGRTEEAEIDGWLVKLHERDTQTLKFRATARDEMWQRYAESFGLDKHDALRKLADKTGIDYDELTRTFGV